MAAYIHCNTKTSYPAHICNDRQQATLNGIQNDHTLQQQRTPYLCTSNMEQAHCHGCCPKSFSVIHHQREPVFLWRNGNEFKTNHHHHQSVACDLLVGGTRMGFHCTQVNCSQNRYDIKDMLFACGRCWIQSRRAPTDCLQVSCTIKLCVCCIFRLSLN